MNRVFDLFVHFFRDPDPKEYTVNDHRWNWRPISQNPFVERKHRDKRVPNSPAMNLEDPVIYNDAPKWVHLFYDLAWTATFASLTQNGRFNQPWDTVSYVGFFILAWWLWAAQAVYTIHFYTNDWFHFGSNVVQLCIFGMLAATTRGYDISNYIVHSPGTPHRLLEPRPRQLSSITDPGIYNAKVVAATSSKVIIISVTMSRMVLLVQYIRVIIYARAVVPKDHHALRKISVVPICMVVSITLFVAAWMISVSDAGKTAHGATVKVVFWGIALAFEALSHIVMALLDWRRPSVEGKPAQSAPVDSRIRVCSWCSEPLGTSQHFPERWDPMVILLTEGQSARSDLIEPEGKLIQGESLEGESDWDERRLPVPYSGVTLSDRLEGVTTIILGEGINSIAGSLWAVTSAPGYENSVSTNAISAAITVCFITYFYFEGPKGRQDPTGIRQMVWLFLHLPFLLGIILLLLGMKNQFLLTSFLSTVSNSLEFTYVIDRENLTPLNPDSGNSLVVKDFFIKRGVMWSEEWTRLLNKLGPIEGGKMNQSQNFDVIAWQWRLMLTLCVNSFKTFMGDAREIPDDVQSAINLYNTNRTIPVLDGRAWNWNNNTETMHFYKVLTPLVDTNVQGARYITGLAGGVLIFLSLLDLVHSKPRDRFQWGIILTRFAMGWCLVFLLLLNLGRYQTLWIHPIRKKHQAGVFQWINVYWALPTIALAHLIELIVETVIAGLAKLRINDRSRANLKADAVEKVGEKTKGGKGNITSELADPETRPLSELAWREGQKVVLALLIQLRLKKPKPTELTRNS